MGKRLCAVLRVNIAVVLQDLLGSSGKVYTLPCAGGEPASSRDTESRTTPVAFNESQKLPSLRCLLSGQL